jgi:uncharacterized protein YdiU (UPF0061 family)
MSDAPSAPASSPTAGWNLDHSYSRLPALFFRSATPAPVKRSGLAVFNEALAVSLGLDPECLRQPDQAALFTGNLLPAGANPIAQAYAGHQFGHFTTLGDGRAILLGEQLTPDGRRFDIQLKGSGRTPFSRGGDGLAALGPMLREYLISEAMHALGIPTTRSLAVATTGATVFRSEELPGAVLTRVAASHIRVGTFQWAAVHEDHDALRALADHTRRRHFPDLAEASHLDFFHAVMERQAALVAKWLQVGFIHGVMNTDNMALSGETIDYGPCAFLDAYHSDTVFSSIDHAGRYAYAQQPSIARWNLARLAEAMIPLLHDDGKKAVELANEALHQFQGIFQNHWLDGMRAKLGIHNSEPDDLAFVQHLLDWMQENKQDFTGTFSTLSSAASLEAPVFPDAAFTDWHAAWQSRLTRQAEGPAEILHRMRSANPRVIPRNHKVEEALSAATLHTDLAPFHKLLAAITRPFDEAEGDEFTTPPPSGSPRYQTFCGT